MPAIEHSFLDRPLPETIALDADFILTVLVDSEPFHRSCTSLARSLVNGRVRIVHSPLIRLEFLNAWRKAIRRNAVTEPPASQRNFWDDPGPERSERYAFGEQLLAGFLGLFPQYEVRFNKTLQRETRNHMAQHNLNSMDACLLASAYRAGTEHIASLDSDFRHVDGIHLWNDHIPRKRQAARRRRRP